MIYGGAWKAVIASSWCKTAASGTYEANLTTCKNKCSAAACQESSGPQWSPLTTKTA